MLRLLSILMLMAPFALAQRENDVKGEDSVGPGSGVRTAVGPDAFGYEGRDETEPFGPVYDFIDISGTGTDLMLSGDDAGVTAPIGFAFNFYGIDYTDVGISSNGYLNFNPGGDLVDFGNDCPGLNAFDPDQSAFVYWDDLVADGTAFIESFGVCPNQSGGPVACTIIMWQDARHLGGVELFDLEAILYANGNILMQYPAGNPETGDGATIGLENETPSTIGLDYACNTPGTIPANRAILFQHPNGVIAQIPTLGTYGLVIFIVLFAGVGVWLMARRRRAA